MKCKRKNGFINAPIAQLDRAFDYGSKGCGFDSYWARHLYRDVAQLGSALDLGSRGRRFKSCHPDHLKGYLSIAAGFFIFLPISDSIVMN